MGRGIAYLSALAGYETVLNDVTRDLLQSAENDIRSIFERGLERKKITQESFDTALSRLQTSLRPGAGRTGS